MKVRHLIVACILVGSLASSSLVAYAQPAPGQMAITRSYIMTLSVQPAMPMILASDEAAGLSGEVLVSTGPGVSPPSMVDQGHLANHFVSVQIVRKSTNSLATDLPVQFLVYNQDTGETRRYPVVPAMAPSSDPSDVEFGRDIWLPSGTYTFTVIVENDQAAFPNILVR